MDLPDKSPGNKQRVKKKAVVPAGAAASSTKPPTKRLMEHLFAESPKAIGKNVFRNVIVPRGKMAVQEALGSAIQAMLWGGQGGGVMSNMIVKGQGVVLNPTGSGIDYNALSNPAVLPSNSVQGPYKDLKFITQEQAEAVLASILGDLNQYRVVTVADLYEAANLTPEIHHQNLGWYSLEGARFQREGTNIVLALPKPVRV